jgi:hypothetical protein
MIRKKTLLFIFIIIILAVGAVAGEIYITKKNVQLGEEAIEVDKQQPTGTGIDTSNWKTYRNEAHKYEIKYPKDSKKIQESEKEVSIELPITPGTALRGKSLTISVEQTTSGECSPLHAPEVKKPEIIHFGNINFIKEIGYEAAAGSMYESIRYSTLKEGKCFHLTFVLRSANPGVFPTPPPRFDREKESEIFDQIVSTFRFVK